MVRWRYALILGMLLLLPTLTDTKLDEEDGDEERRDEIDEEDEDDDDDDDDDSSVNKEDRLTVSRRIPIVPTVKTLAATRTLKKRPLECFVCAYKSETPLRACLDPTKYRVHTITCHGAEDKCFTSVISKGNTYEVVVRGCRSSCIGSPETTCCELNRCNSQAFALPIISPKVLMSKSNKSLPPPILFFVTILLVLQTVVKVAFV